MSIFLNGKRFQVAVSKNGTLSRVSFPSQFIHIPQASTTIEIDGSIGRIYSAIKAAGHQRITVDWGDGTKQEYTGDITSASHQYGSSVNVVQSISNNVSSLNICGGSSLDSIVSVQNMGGNITEIQTGCFYNCPKLDYVCFGRGVSSIRPNSFSNCTALRYISFEGKNQGDIVGMQNYTNWFYNCVQAKLVFWTKGSESGCFVYGDEDAAIMADDSGTMRIISDDDDNLIDKE